MKTSLLRCGELYAWKPGKYDRPLPVLVLDPSPGYYVEAGHPSWRVEDLRVARYRTEKRLFVAIGIPQADRHAVGVDLADCRWYPFATPPGQIRRPWSEQVALDVAEAERLQRQRVLRAQIDAYNAERAAVERAEREKARAADLHRRNVARAQNDEYLETRILPTLEDVLGREVGREGDLHDRVTLSLDDLQRIVDAVSD